MSASSVGPAPQAVSLPEAQATPPITFQTTSLYLSRSLQSATGALTLEKLDPNQGADKIRVIDLKGSTQAGSPTWQFVADDRGAAYPQQAARVGPLQGSFYLPERHIKDFKAEGSAEGGLTLRWKTIDPITGNESSQDLTLIHAAWSDGVAAIQGMPTEIKDPDLLYPSLAVADAFRQGWSHDDIDHMLATVSQLPPDAIERAKGQALELLGISDRQIKIYSEHLLQSLDGKNPESKQLAYPRKALQMRAALDPQVKAGQAWSETGGEGVAGFKGCIAALQQLQSGQFQDIAGQVVTEDDLIKGRQQLAEASPLSPLGPERLLQATVTSNDGNVAAAMEQRLLDLGLAPQLAHQVAQSLWTPELELQSAVPPTWEVAQKFLVDQKRLHGNPLPSDYVRAALASSGEIADPNKLTPAEQQRCQGLIDQWAHSGLEGLSAKDQALIKQAAINFLQVDAYLADRAALAQGGLTDVEIGVGLEMLQQRVQAEAGMATPSIPPRDLDYQSLLAGGSDSDRLNMFAHNSAANFLKAQQNDGSLGKTDTWATAYQPYISVFIYAGGGMPSPEIKKPLSSEQQAFVDQWVADHGPITQDNRNEMLDALQKEHPLPWLSGGTYALDSAPDPWLGQKENIQVLQQASGEAYRSWGQDNKPLVYAPDDLAQKLVKDLETQADGKSLAELMKSDQAGSAQLSSLESWLPHLAENRADILNPIAVQNKHLPTVARLLDLTGLADAIYTSAKPPEYTDVQSTVHDLLEHYGRSTSTLDEAMKVAQDQHRADLWSEWGMVGVNAAMVFAGVGMEYGGALLSSLAEGELASAGSVLGQAGIAFATGVLDPLNIAQNGPKAVDFMSKHGAELFKRVFSGLENSEALIKAGKDLVDANLQSRDPRAALPLEEALIDQLEAEHTAGHLNAPQAELLSELKTSAAKLRANLESAKATEARISEGPAVSALIEDADVVWNSEGWGVAQIQGKTVQVIRTADGELLIGKPDALTNGKGFYVFEAGTERPVRKYVNMDSDGWQRQRLQGGALYHLTEDAPSDLTSLAQLPNNTLAEIFGRLDSRTQEALLSVNKRLRDVLRLEATDINVAGNELSAALEKFPKASKIKILGDITAEQWATLANASNLEGLDLSGCTNLTDGMLESLSHMDCFANLRSLNLSGCSDITDAGLAPLQGLHQLSSLNLAGCSDITNAGLAYLSGLDKLESLDLNLCINVTDEGLAHLRDLRNLKALDLSSCALITDAGMVSMEGLENLSSLNLSSCGQVTDATLAHLRNLKKLSSLDLGGCSRITDEGLAHLGGLTNLSALDLNGCGRITDTGLAHLRPLENLSSLNLSRCGLITEAGLAHLQVLRKLKHLDLSLCGRITDAGLAHLSSLEALESLNLNLCPEITNEGVAHLGQLRNLNTLDLSWCPQIDDGGLAHLHNLTELTSLNLMRCGRITDAGLAHLSDLKNLVALDLSWCPQITDAGLVHLQGLEKLRFLNSIGCDQITEEGRASLIGLEDLP